METVRTVFTPGQLHILEMLKYCKTDDAVQELQDVLADYYARKVQEEADKLWDEGVLNAEAIEKLSSSHLRTPYIHE